MENYNEYRRITSRNRNSSSIFTSITQPPPPPVTPPSDFLDDIDSSSSNNEIVMYLARAVGILVGIVAIVSWFFIMITFKASLSWVIQWVGVTGVLLLLLFIFTVGKRYGRLSLKHVWTMFTRSCT